MKYFSYNWPFQHLLPHVFYYALAAIVNTFLLYIGPWLALWMFAGQWTGWIHDFPFLFLHSLLPGTLPALLFAFLLKTLATRFRFALFRQWVVAGTVIGSLTIWSLGVVGITLHYGITPLPRWLYLSLFPVIGGPTAGVSLSSQIHLWLTLLPASAATSIVLWHIGRTLTHSESRP